MKNEHRASVYDLNPKTFASFDLVFFFSVLYHLRHPLLALEKIHSRLYGNFVDANRDERRLF